MMNPLIVLPGLLLALVLHEYAHARVAYALGDPTAQQQGRLTLNPIVHIDPVGLIMLWVFRFGWAKPVPINPYYFRDPRRGMLLVALAGPVTNVILAFVILLLVRTGLLDGFSGAMGQAVQYAYTINLFLAVFNILPVPPLDGSRILAGLVPSQYAHWVDQLETHGWLILIILLLTGAVGRILLPLVGILDNILRRLVPGGF